MARRKTESKPRSRKSVSDDQVTLDSEIFEGFTKGLSGPNLAELARIVTDEMVRRVSDQ